MKLVFVHGSGGSGLVWKYQLERFPDALAVTLPGHPDGKPCESIEDAVRWLREELGGAKDVVLIGHSLGGGIALQYALDHPDELAGIVPIGSGARLRVHPATLGALEKMLDAPAGFSEMMGESWTEVPSDFAEELRARATEFGPRPFLNDLRACDRFDIVDRIGEIAVPTLAIVGTKDVMTPPKYSEFLRDKMPNASVEIIEGGTHFVFAEQPELVNDAIDRFLAALSS